MIVEFILEWIGTIFFLILGGISMSKRILKPKTQIYTNCIGLAANLLYMVWGVLLVILYNRGHSLIILEAIFSIMSLYCIIKFRRIYKNAT